MPILFLFFMLLRKDRIIMTEGNFTIALYCCRLPWAKKPFVWVPQGNSQRTLSWGTFLCISFTSFLFTKWQLDCSKSDTDEEAYIIA